MKVGDQVLYFSQGHQEVLTQFPISETPPWQRFPQIWPVVKAVVSDINYSFPYQQTAQYAPSIVCLVSLRITGIPSQQSSAMRSTRGSVSSQLVQSLTFVDPSWNTQSESNEMGTSTVNERQNQLDPSVSDRLQSMATHFWEFSVEYRPDIPDFLVPFHRFLDAQRRTWIPRERCVMLWHEEVQLTRASSQGRGQNRNRSQNRNRNRSQAEEPENLAMYHGTVLEVSEKEPARWPNSPWDCVMVRWDDGSEDRVSPWEIVPENEANSIDDVVRKMKMNERRVSIEHRGNLSKDSIKKTI